MITTRLVKHRSEAIKRKTKYQTQEQIMNEISVNKLRLELNVGWTPEERAHPQVIDINFTVRFTEELPACRTDKLDDTVCYALLCNKLKSYCRSRQFRLIEHLGWSIARILEQAIREATSYHPEQIEVTIHKPHAPIPGLTGGVSFRLIHSPSPG